MKISKVLRLFLAGKFKSFNETFFEIFKLCVSLSISILEEAENIKNSFNVCCLHLCLYVCLIDFCLVLNLDFGSKKLVKL